MTVRAIILILQVFVSNMRIQDVEIALETDK